MHGHGCAGMSRASHDDVTPGHEPCPVGGAGGLHWPRLAKWVFQYPPAGCKTGLYSPKPNKLLFAPRDGLRPADACRLSSRPEGGDAGRRCRWAGQPDGRLKGARVAQGRIFRPHWRAPAGHLLALRSGRGSCSHARRVVRAGSPVLAADPGPQRAWFRLLAPQNPEIAFGWPGVGPGGPSASFGRA